MASKFLADREGYYVFGFTCSNPLCELEAELGVPKKQAKLVTCPDCGNLYVLVKPTGLFQHPRLESVLSDPKRVPLIAQTLSEGN